MLIASIAVTASAERADFEYKLILTDENGAEVTNPRKLKAGSTLNVEIEMSMKGSTDPTYISYGLEFRLESRGLEYNRDGSTFRAGTGVNSTTFTTGEVVGFAYYDLTREGETVSNPMRVCSWSYTVTDPSAVNITVPTALLYIRDDSEPYVPIGTAWLFLDPNGGQIVGVDVSGEYPSGTVVTLPDAKFADYTFQGWTDGVKIYPAGSEYTVTGVVTLTAIWENLERTRQVIWDPQGGTFVEEDPSGMFADGEVITMPEVQYEGYSFDGWWLNQERFEIGDQYTVDNSLLFLARWKPVETIEPPPDEEAEHTTPGIPGILETIGILAAIGLGWWLLIILWARRWVKYSLVNGDVALSHKDKEHNVQVQVVLFDEDNRRMLVLGQSGVVPMKHRLRFIKGAGPEAVVDVKPGRYKGKLVITDAGFITEKECRIKVLDRELRERENK